MTVWSGRALGVRNPRQNNKNSTEHPSNHLAGTLYTLSGHITYTHRSQQLMSRIEYTKNNNHFTKELEVWVSLCHTVNGFTNVYVTIVSTESSVCFHYLSQSVVKQPPSQLLWRSAGWGEEEFTGLGLSQWTQLPATSMAGFSGGWGRVLWPEASTLPNLQDPWDSEKILHNILHRFSDC